MKIENQKLNFFSKLNNAPNSLQLDERFEEAEKKSLARAKFSYAGQRRLKTETRTLQLNILPFQNVWENKTEKLELAEILKKYAPNGRPYPHDRTIQNAILAGDERAVKLLYKYNACDGARPENLISLAISVKSTSILLYLLTIENNTSDLKEEQIIGMFNQCLRTDFWDGIDCFVCNGIELPDALLPWVIRGYSIIDDLQSSKTNIEKFNFLITRGLSSDSISKFPILINQAIACNEPELLEFLLKHKSHTLVDKNIWHTTHFHAGRYSEYIHEQHPLYLAITLGKNLNWKPRNETKNELMIHMLISYGIEWSPHLNNKIWDTLISSNIQLPTIKTMIETGLSITDFPRIYHHMPNALCFFLSLFSKYRL